MNQKRELGTLLLMSAAITTSSTILSVLVEDLMYKITATRSRSVWHIAKMCVAMFVCNLLLVGLLFRATKLVPLSYYR